ncbi:hypothetical protein CRUP_014238, partial [Coryphaenoides rupestris]
PKFPEPLPKTPEAARSPSATSGCSGKGSSSSSRSRDALLLLARRNHAALKVDDFTRPSTASINRSINQSIDRKAGLSIGGDRVIGDSASDVSRQRTVWMPTLGMMEQLSRQLCGKMRRSGKRTPIPTSPSSCSPPRGLEVHFYLADTNQLEYFKDCYTAENLCVEAAKRCSISPLCHNLFRCTTSGLWFYFKNWHGTTEGESSVWRHCISKLRGGSPSISGGTPLLDAPSLDYLFAQGQHDFHKGLAPLRSPQLETDQHDMENECLGMAVLAITHHAMSQDIPLSTASNDISYKRFIPESLNLKIKQRNVLTRLRIGSVFKKFLQEFNQHTVQDSNITLYDLKIKYLATLESLTSDLGSETLEPASLSISLDRDVAGYYTQVHVQGQSPEPSPESNQDMQVQVTGTEGISWRRKPLNIALIPKEKTKKKKFDGKYKKDKAKEQMETWEVFCDFHEITHIVIKDATATIYRQDNKRLELQLSSRAEALSFVALVDGYFRLAVDAHHFLCKDVAPASVARNLENGCHGPIRESRVITQYKNFQVEVSPRGFCLDGTDTCGSSLRELLEHLSGQNLRADQVEFQLLRCCPPQPRELSNLLVVTNKRAELFQTREGDCQVNFVPIRLVDIKQKEQFYNAEVQLATPDDEDLARFMTHCMNYDPKMRPFFRAIVRDIDRLLDQNPSIKPIPTQGGHFGRVELFRYDPRGDRTGELVAVKSLTPANRNELNCNLLKDYLPRNRNKPLHTLLSYALQICKGMEYLGSLNYIHRDLAARNVLVENESTVKIGDFGLTKSMEGNKNYYTVKDDNPSPVFWYAPECLTLRKFYLASDVWSFGMTLYEVITYCHPASSPMTVYALMHRCWEHTPDKRISFKCLIEELTHMLQR